MIEAAGGGGSTLQTIAPYISENRAAPAIFQRDRMTQPLLPTATGIRLFGFNRSMFAGNWFVINSDSSFQQWASAFVSIVSTMRPTDADWRSLLQDTAQRAYALSPPSSIKSDDPERFVLMGGYNANMSSQEAVSLLTAAHFTTVDSAGDDAGVTLAEAAGHQVMIPFNPADPNLKKRNESKLVIAINIADEPHCQDFAQLAKTYQQARQLFPTKRIFINLRPIPDFGNGKIVMLSRFAVRLANPESITISATLTFGVGCETYEQYVDTFIEVVKPNLLSYDCTLPPHCWCLGCILARVPAISTLRTDYPEFGRVGDGGTARGPDLRLTYLRNLEVLRVRAVKLGVPLWMYL